MSSKDAYARQKIRSLSANVSCLFKKLKEEGQQLDDLEDLVNEIGSTNVQVTYYETIDISSGTAGTITFPEGATLIEGINTYEGNAVLSTIAGTGEIEFKTPQDSSGDVITANLDSSGNWMSSDIFPDPVVLVYRLTISIQDLTNLNESNIVDFYQLPSSTQVDNDSDIPVDTVTDALNYLQSQLGVVNNVKRYRLTTTDPQNFNAVGATLIDWNIEDLNEDNTIFEKITNGVRVKVASSLSIIVYFTYEDIAGNNQRLTLAPEILFNGVPQGIQGRTGYLRDTGGHLASTAYVQYYFPSVPVNTDITINSNKVYGALGGVVNIDPLNSYVELAASNPVQTSPPVVTAPALAEVITLTKGVPTTYQAMATNTPTSWSISPPVSGVTINSQGLIAYDGLGTVGNYPVNIQASNTAGNSAPVSFTIDLEEGVPPNSVVLLDGQSLDALVDGANVPSWSDESGNNNDYNQATLLNQPTLNRDAYGVGNHSVVFNGSTSFLQCVSTTAALLGLAPSEGEVWIVMKKNAQIGAAIMADFPRNGNGNTNASFYSIGYDINFSTNGSIGNANSRYGARGRQAVGNNYRVASANGNIGTGNSYILRGLYHGGNLQIWRDNSLRDSETYTAPSYDGDSGNFLPVLGRRANSGSNYAQMEVAFFAVYARSLTTVERDALYNYLSNRFGI